jgi:hypothetical protein
MRIGRRGTRGREKGTQGYHVDLVYGGVSGCSCEDDI